MKKKGAGGEPQEYNADTGQYGSGDGKSDRDKKAAAIRKYSDDPEKDLVAEGLPSGALKYGAHRDIPTGMTKEQFVAKELGVDESKAKDYVKAVDFYSDEKYKEIRSYQQGKVAAEDIQKAENDLEDYIVKAPKWDGGATFRGIGLSDDDLAKYTVESVHDMRGSSSWSNEPIIAEDFADYYGKGQNAVIFHSPTQSKGTSIRHLAKETGENEVLVSKESKYKVVRQKKDKQGRIHIFLEETK